MHQFSESQTKVLWSAIILKIIIGKACPFSSSAIQNLIIIAIFKLMALRDTLVYDWQLVHLLILVCYFQWCVLFLCLAMLYSSCPIRDKGLLIGSQQYMRGIYDFLRLAWTCEPTSRLATHRKSVRKCWFWKVASTCIDLRVRLSRALYFFFAFFP